MSKDFELRKNVSLLSDKERSNFIESLIALNTHTDLRFCGDRNDKPFVGGVSYWFKQDEIHQATHVHGGPAFLPWHRELCNRFEKLLRKYDKRLSLHYWDWNTDPNATPDEQ